MLLVTALIKPIFLTGTGKVSNHVPVRKRILYLKHVERAFLPEHDEDEFWTLSENRHDRLLQSFSYNMNVENDELNDEINSKVTSIPSEFPSRIPTIATVTDRPTTISLLSSLASPTPSPSMLLTSSFLPSLTTTTTALPTSNVTLALDGRNANFDAVTSISHIFTCDPASINTNLSFSEMQDSNSEILRFRYEAQTGINLTTESVPFLSRLEDSFASFIASKTILPCSSETHQRYLSLYQGIMKHRKSSENSLVNTVVGVDAYPPDVIDQSRMCYPLVSDAQGCYTVNAAVTFYFHSTDINNTMTTYETNKQRKDIMEMAFQDLKDSVNKNNFLNDDVLHLTILDQEIKTESDAGDMNEKQFTTLNNEQHELPPEESIVLITDNETVAFMSSPQNNNRESVVQYSLAVIVVILTLSTFLVVMVSRNRRGDVEEESQIYVSGHEENLFVNDNQSRYRCSPQVISNGEQHYEHI